MELGKMVVKCKKTLIHSDGTTSFVKGNTYRGKRSNSLENLCVKNENDEYHNLGCWSKHFREI